MHEYNQVMIVDKMFLRWWQLLHQLIRFRIQLQSDEIETVYLGLWLDSLWEVRASIVDEALAGHQVCDCNLVEVAPFELKLGHSFSCLTHSTNIV